MDDISIKNLLVANEDEHLQFKEAKEHFDFVAAAKCCCALSNCGGGKLVLGISDKRPRAVVGTAAFQQPEGTRRALIDKLKVMVDFRVHNLDDKRVLEFVVAKRPLGLPVQLDGIAWVYEGDSLRAMPEETRRKIYAEIGIDFSGTVCETATLADLDESAIEVFREKWANKNGNTRIKTQKIENLLYDCGAITDDGVTYAALVLFGKKTSLGKLLPQAETIFEYRSSEEAGPAAQREEFKAGFFSYCDQIWKLIDLRNEKQHYQEGFFIRDIPTFNERVVREAILNAICHRNYQMVGSVFVRQYKERLVVESPGGFPMGITTENILYRQAPRNRRIAEILSLCGLVERSGQGMNLIYETNIREAKSLPDFSGTDENFVCIALPGLIIDKKMLLLISKIGDTQLINFSTLDFITIDALYHEKKINNNLKSSLRHLVEIGIVEHTGHGKYILSRNLYEAVGKPGVHTRKIGLDRETNKELILKHLVKKAHKGTPLKELLQVLPGLSRGRIQILVRELRREGRIYNKGVTRGALWFIVTQKNQNENRN